MVVVMLLLVRDEADIIRFNLEYHLNAAIDHIIITDNMSVDGTRDILSEYSHLPEVTLRDERGDDYAQGRWVTRMARIAIDELGADWILSSDADEFWCFPETSLKTTLLDIESDILFCRRRNMVYAYDGDELEPWFDRAVFRASPPVPSPVLDEPLIDPLPAPYFNLDLPPKTICRAEGLKQIRQGNHGAEYTHHASITESDIVIYHYPVRSRSQFERKILQGGEAYERNTELSTKVGWHWRRWHRMIQESDVDAALADALPSGCALIEGVAAGQMLRDETMVEKLQQIKAGSGRQSSRGVREEG